MLPDILFYLFAIGLLLGAGAVITARNPMYGVLGMIFSFINAAGLFMLFYAEFLSLLIVMIYVGAIAVMFLFVLMTIDIDFVKLREGFAPYLPAGLIVAAALAAELLLAASLGLFTGVGTPIAAAEGAPTNIEQLGAVLFTDYALPFQAAGMVLLTAMVGAIILTHRRRKDVKRQNISMQINRTASDSMALTKPVSGQGATPLYWSPKPVDKVASNDEDDQ
ncbi:MAG TPA: NADH-quinone oxidoreductase subunit J [Alphaproteobacteria bacterium]|nr:NADH-quinone oxidoreductase subunit J [Alphaproteobacteria bacterium]